MTAKRGIADLDPKAVEGKRALVRVDFNVPVKDGVVGDDTRIRAALPTIRALKQLGARVVLLSHLGRPKGGGFEAKYSLKPVAAKLEALLGSPVTFIADAAAPAAAEATRALPRGGVALVENTRFLPGEEQNDGACAGLLAKLGDFFVNDAFGSAHRGHASTEAVAHLLKPAVAGYLMQKELDYLGKALAAPVRPFVAVLGGAKISGKIDVITSLLARVDQILIGGAMANTFFKAQGASVGTSLVEDDRLAMALDLLAQAGPKIVLPESVVVAKALEQGETRREVEWNAIPDGFGVYDIGRTASTRFAALIKAAKTVVWNGPMGVFETKPFDEGTRAVAQALADATAKGAVTVVGGGASLEFLEGKVLPGVAALDDRAA